MRTILAALVLFAGTILLPVTTAQADVLDATCAGSATTMYTPGLTLDAKRTQVDWTLTLAACESLSDPALTSGTSSWRGVASPSCLTLGGATTGSVTITWNTSETSTYTYNRSTTIAAGQMIANSTGTVTQGKFSGDAVAAVFTGPAPSALACASSGGLGSINQVVTLEVTSL